MCQNAPGLNICANGHKTWIVEPEIKVVHLRDMKATDTYGCAAMVLYMAG
jgi:hypothetical protein